MEMIAFQGHSTTRNSWRAYCLHMWVTQVMWTPAVHR